MTNTKSEPTLISETTSIFILNEYHISHYLIDPTRKLRTITIYALEEHFGLKPFVPLSFIKTSFIISNIESLLWRRDGFHNLNGTARQTKQQIFLRCEESTSTKIRASKYKHKN